MFILIINCQNHRSSKILPIHIISTSDDTKNVHISRRKKHKFAHAHDASYAKCKASKTLSDEKSDEVYISPEPRDIFYQRWRCINPFFLRATTKPAYSLRINSGRVTLLSFRPSASRASKCIPMFRSLGAAAGCELVQKRDAEWQSIYLSISLSLTLG